jgi:hypothetical protein
LGLVLNQSTRAPRYAGRATLRTITGVTRCFDCGWETTTSAGIVSVRKTDDGVVGFAGLTTCGRVWLCPVCNAKVMARRAVEIGAALTWATVEGLLVGWGSLTLRHNRFTTLAGMIEIQQAAWRHVMQSRLWTKRSATATRDHVCSQTCESSCERKRDTYDTGRPGRVGYIRAAEVTQNFDAEGNGWHPHFHPIILWRGDQAGLQAFLDDVVTLWIEGVEKAGGEAGRHGAQQLRVLTGVEMYDALSGYVTKATYDPARLALETVWSQGKSGRGRIKGTRSHWELLAAMELEVGEGQEDPSALWLELEHATNGHRMITWSRGLRRFAGLADEKDDEEVAAEVVGDKTDTVAVITGQGWISVRDRPYVLALILDTLEGGTVDDLVAVLEENDVDWVTLDQVAAGVYANA